MDENTHNQLFERTVRPHFDRLYRLAWRLTGSQAEAEDLFQDLLIRAYEKLDDLVSFEHPASWLCRVMYNMFVDQHRRFARQRMHLVDEGHLPGGGVAELPGGDSPVAEQERSERNARLGKALAELSDEHRIIVLLHDTEGYKLTEIQDLMGIPVGTVKSRLHRARARLRQILEREGTFP